MSTSNNNKMPLTSSEIPGLDTLLGGGLPVGSLFVVVGPPGTGKTLFLQQLCFGWVRRLLASTSTESANANEELIINPVTFRQAASSKAKAASAQNSSSPPATALYFSLLSEPHTKLLQHVSQFEFYEQSWIGEHVKLLSLTQPMEEGLEKLISTIVNSARQEKARLVTIDGLGVLADLPMPLSLTPTQTQPATIRQFLYHLSSQLSILGITTVVTIERTLEKDFSEGELTVADGILHFSRPLVGSRRLRRAEVLKLRGMNILDGLHGYEITTQKGLYFYPRTGALTKHRLEEREGERARAAGVSPDLPKSVPVPAPLSRVQSGLTELDKLLGGGLPTGSATLVAGSSGVGKTLVSLHYLIAAASRGEPSLYVGFHEDAEQLVSKAARCGLNLADFVASGLISLVTITPIELEPDKVFDTIWQRLTNEHAPIPVKHVVVDGLQELELACLALGRGRDFIAGMLASFKELDLTSLYTHEISKLIGTELDLSQTNFVPLAENLLLLKQVEYHTKLYSIIAVLKMRDSQYDHSLRQFVITDEVGLEVLEPLTSAEGLLSGLARQLAR